MLRILPPHLQSVPKFNDCSQPKLHPEHDNQGAERQAHRKDRALRQLDVSGIRNEGAYDRLEVMNGCFDYTPDSYLARSFVVAT